MEQLPRTMVTGTAPPLGFAVPAELDAERHQSHLRAYWIIKRVMDVAIALTVLTILSPLFLLIALLIKLYDAGPALFVQERVGYDPRTGTLRLFRLYKFRSMLQNVDTGVHRQYMGDLIRNNVAAPAGGCLKMTSDRRITGIGCVLRKSSIDELPQLINVLKGDMSLVGPRPALLYEVELYQEWHKRRLTALPGMTGLWQVAGRNLVSFDEGVQMDIFYVEHQCFLLDLRILLLTPLAVIKGRGAG